MAYCKRFLIVFLIFFILFFNFTSVFAVEDIPEGYNLINQNILLTSGNINSSGLVENKVNSTIYYIDISNFSSVLYFNTKGLRFFLTNDIDFTYGDYLDSPAHEVTSNTNGIYLDTSSISEKYLVLSYYIDNSVQVYGKDYTAMADGIQGLVDNVGPNAFWGVFGSGIDFVFVIVIVVFGLFIIVKLIKGLSKGKSKI